MNTPGSNARADGVERVLRWGLGFYAAAHVAFLIFLFANHNGYPFLLDLMEGTVLEHAERAAELRAIYPEPTPEFVPLAYNALYYVLAIPFVRLFGPDLPTLRLVSALGAAVVGFLLFSSVRRHTGSRWWGLIAVGLFAAAYQVMDAYLDTAHSDSWMVASALLGSYLLDRQRGRAWTVVALLALVASFWFKQHGAWFVIGGVAYLTWRDGLRRSLPWWAIAAVTGPGLYFLAGRALFGPWFHEFTWEVPRRWTEPGLHTLIVYGGFVAACYPLLAAAAAGWLLDAARRARERLTIWHFQLVAGMVSGLMGALDRWSSFNVFVPMGVMFILAGTIGLARWSESRSSAWGYRLPALAVGASFALFVWNPIIGSDPRDVIMPSDAGAAYRDLVDLLQDLDGPVYAPGVGRMPGEPDLLYPGAHWVALEDMVRGPGRNTEDHPDVRRLLAPAIPDAGPAYVLTSRPLAERRHFLGFLERRYDLQEDFGDRFRSLRGLPARYDHGWPRYLYRLRD